MDKICFSCGEHTYIRILKSGEVGKICEACQMAIIGLAVEGKLGKLGIENNLEIVIDS